MSLVIFFALWHTLTATASNDAASLVQSRISASEPVEPDAAPDNRTVEVKSLKRFRITISKTNKGDHACFNEIEFYDMEGGKMFAEYEEMSSCYGCATTCDVCDTAFGNPNALLDGNDTKWICTAAGTFSKEPRGQDTNTGAESMIFLLPTRPSKYSLISTEVGDWSTVSFSMQVEMPDGTWGTISRNVEETPEATQTGVCMLWGTFDQPPVFPDDYDKCVLPEEFLLNHSNDTHNISGIDFYDVRQVPGRVLTNNGHGIQIDGGFGSIRNPSGAVSSIVQLNWVFPSNLRLPNGEKAIGELHLVTVLPRKDVVETGWKSEDLAKIIVLLQLPEEHAGTSDTERFFLKVGMASIPEKGDPLSLPGKISLEAFKKHFDESAATQLPCGEGSPQFVLSKPAFVSGIVVEAFRTKFPNPLNFTSNLNEEAMQTIEVNNAFDMSGALEHQRIAYATGEWAVAPPAPPKEEANETDADAAMAAAMGSL